MDIYTAHYRYIGSDRLDITVKSATYPADVFAPTWNMVQDYKAQKINEWEYTQKYMGLLCKRWYQDSGRTNKAIQTILANRSSLTLVCFCTPQTFCHRILAARILQEMGLGKYHGERIL